MLKIIAITLSVLILFFVIDLTRRERLTFKYAFGWMCVCLLAIIISIFDTTVESLAHVLGFELASNFIFFGLLACLVALSLLMTLFLCEQNTRNDLMAQKIGLLELELNKLKEIPKEDNDK